LWRQYKTCGLPVAKADFREAYVHGERTMGKLPLVKPTDNFHQVLIIKSRLQLQFLVDKKCLCAEKYPVETYAQRLADGGYAVAKETVNNARKVLQRLKKEYKLVLVSNFYGNIRTILEDFDLLCYFEEVIESSVVGVRKPDPAIFALGVEALDMVSEEVVVVGDSYTKDILPAHSLGCHTVWLKGVGWEPEEHDETLPSAVISSLEEVPEVVEGLL
jgi:putative hydrolase of the HAD superfamily